MRLGALQQTEACPKGVPRMIAAEPTQASTERIVQTKEWKVQIFEAGSGFPIIMLHGSGPGATGWTNFAPNVVELSKKYHVIAMTFPGWGSSDPVVPRCGAATQNQRPCGKTPDGRARVEKAALVGNSMGGAAVQQFITDFPERLSHFVTMGAVAPGVSLFQPGGLTEGIKILGETYRNPTKDNFRRLVSIMVLRFIVRHRRVVRDAGQSCARQPGPFDKLAKPQTQRRSRR